MYGKGEFSCNRAMEINRKHNHMKYNNFNSVPHIKKKKKKIRLAIFNQDWMWCYNTTEKGRIISDEL